MEEYINKDTIVKNDTYELLKDSIFCPICSNLMIEPVICLICQNIYCKKCIESRKTKGEGCPNNCKNAEIKDVIQENNLITKCKFKCIKGCGEEIPFNDIKNHYSSNYMLGKSRIKVVDKKMADEYSKHGKIPIFKSISIIIGKGTVSRAASIVNNNSVGNNS